MFFIPRKKTVDGDAASKAAAEAHWFLYRIWIQNQTQRINDNFSIFAQWKLQ